MEVWRDQFFKRNGRNTVEARIANERIIFTIDPDNIKAVLATQFSDFGKGEPFRQEWGEFLGDSIFTTDGAMWHNSRQMLRPQFTRDRVSDLECFESHMETLFKAMANGAALQGEDQPVDLRSVNGKVIDIADLFYRYTLDVATDFLLGTDVKSMRYVGPPFPSSLAVVLTPYKAPPSRSSPRPSTTCSASKTSRLAPTTSVGCFPSGNSAPTSASSIPLWDASSTSRCA
jgi:cytochrome P450